jgi:L-fuconolactonase
MRLELRKSTSSCLIEAGSKCFRRRERIDAHHHLWKYNAGEYAWIDDSMRVLQRDFLPADLEDILQSAGVAGAIAVQARQSLEETNWLLSLAAESSVIRGILGWAPIASREFEAQLASLLTHTRLKGLRHLIQAEPDDNYILRDDFNRGISAMLPSGLVFDILILEKHLPQAIAFVDRHPNQVFVLDHIAKPAISRKEMEPWRSNILKLAERSNVYCKVSGMATEANWNSWSEADLRPFWDTVLAAFGPQRLLFGSDWPVCLVASSYIRWFTIVDRWASELSADEQECVLGATASEVYRLS